MKRVRILVDPDPLFIANKMISSLNFSYLNGKRGIHVPGVLLGIDNPWERIAAATSAGRRGNQEDPRRHGQTSQRHRASGGPFARGSRWRRQEIGYPWAKQAVETIRVVCLALDELVTSRLKELKQQAAASQPQGTA